MKYFTGLLLLIIFSSCSSVQFVPCMGDSSNLNSQQQLMPVAEGNKWVYVTVNLPYQGEPHITGEKSLSIVTPITINYRNHEGLINTTTAYPIATNGVVSSHVYYVECSEGTLYATSYLAKEKELIDAKTIPNNPSENWIDPRKEDYIWHHVGNVTVPAGTFDAWSVTQDSGAESLIEYYSKGVGLIKSEAYNSRGRLYAKMELKSYEIKD